MFSIFFYKRSIQVIKRQQTTDFLYSIQSNSLICVCDSSLANDAERSGLFTHWLCDLAVIIGVTQCEHQAADCADAGCPLLGGAEKVELQVFGVKV